ncbi:WRKY DNA-binding transcription factor 70-like [Arachis stenosperma]|uniref:WRKY DNA-binding transcription factor 70-like n=1 Tax=Arachis stenosperma TaxID=217475 RepID=UPI0025ACA6DA|nr:WRKY DNA-binding transcription factor 70-like [Arachis stenosperma]
MENHHHYSSKGRRELMEQELLRGRDVANQLLQLLVHRSNNNDEQGLTLILPFAEDLVHQVLRSFANTLLLLNISNNSNNIDDAIFPIKDLSSSSPSSCQKHEDLDEACKSFHTNNGRGRYKRKTTAPTWEKDNPILLEDGHAWRKYGQKKTMNSKYLRNYYRCSHKNDEGCPAMKHVQRIQENPPLYRTTYYGHHTCKNTNYYNNEESIILEHESKYSMFLSFNNNNNNIIPILRSTKQEAVELVIHDHHDDPSVATHHQSQLYDHYEVATHNVAMLSSSSSSSPSCTDDTTVHQFDNYDFGWDLDFDGLACFDHHQDQITMIM